MADKRKPLLELDVLVERPFITIGGEPYDLVNVGELTLVDYHRLQKRGEELSAIEGRIKAGTPTEDDMRILEDVNNELFAMVLRQAPKELTARISPVQRRAVVATFFKWLQETKRTPDAPAAAATEPTAPAAPVPSEPATSENPPTGAS